MKPVLLVLALTLLLCHALSAHTLAVNQPVLLSSFDSYFPTYSLSYRSQFNGKMISGINRPSALKIIGNIAIPVGALVATCGGYLYAATGPVKTGQTKRPADPLAVAGLVGGIVLVIGGITLLVVDANSSRKTRWSAITPKNNEFGIAYNF